MQSRSFPNVPRQACRCFCNCYKTLTVCIVLLTFGEAQNPSRLPRKTTLERPKVVRTWCVSTILTSKPALDIFAPQRRTRFQHLKSQRPKVVWDRQFLTFWTCECAPRHGRVHFLQSSSSKSVPTMSFELQTCLSPRPRAFWLPHVRGATLACTFWASKRPKVLRTWCALYVLTSKFASCHSRAHFLDFSTAKAGSNIECFFAFWLQNVLRATAACIFWSLIRPDGLLPATLATLHLDPPLEKHSVSRLFSLFAPLDLLSADSFSAVFFSDLIYLTALNAGAAPVHKSEIRFLKSSTLLLQHEHSSTSS